MHQRFEAKFRQGLCYCGSTHGRRLLRSIALLPYDKNMVDSTNLMIPGKCPSLGMGVRLHFRLYPKLLLSPHSGFVEPLYRIYRIDRAGMPMKEYYLRST